MGVAPQKLTLHVQDALTYPHSLLLMREYWTGVLID